MAGTIKDVEKMTIWQLCDILNYNAIQADRMREEMNKNKSKSKKR